MTTLKGRPSCAKDRPDAHSMSGRIWDALFDAPGRYVDVAPIAPRASIRRRLEQDFGLDIRACASRPPLPWRWALVGMYDGPRYIDFVVNPRLAARCRGGAG